MDIKKIGVISIITLLVFMLALTGCTEKYTMDEVDMKIASAIQPLESNIDSLTNDISILETTESSLKIEVSNLKFDIVNKNNEIVELKEQLQESTEVLEIEEVEEIELTPFYLIEDVGLNEDFDNEDVNNDNLETLFFGEVEYDGEDYNVEEFLLFSNNFKSILNVEDFGSDIAIEIDTYGLSYELVFDDPVLLVEDEDLIINFLGKELIITDSATNEIVFRTSEKISLILDEEYTCQDNIIKVVGFDNDDVNSVLLLVNDELISLEEDDTKRINGIQILVEDIFLSSIGDYNSVSLYIGKDIVETVSNENEFEDDDRYEWIIESDILEISKIGVTLVEELTEEDEVLALGDSISLPYEYKVVIFDSLRELEVVDLVASVGTDGITIDFDGRIEIDGKKIDDGLFTFDGTTVEYEYKDNNKNTTNVSKIVIFIKDRQLSFESDANSFTIGTYKFGYVFGVKEITSAPLDMNEDEDFRVGNGDIFYKSDANNADEEEISISIKLGLVNDEDKEVILKVQ